MACIRVVKLTTILCRNVATISGAVCYEMQQFLAPHRRLSVDARYFVQGNASEMELPRPVQLAGRKYMPGSFEPGLPAYLGSPREGFPLVLKARQDLERHGSVEFWSECFRNQVSQLYADFADKEKRGPVVAVLLRDLPIRSTADFSRFVKCLGYEFFPYQGGGGLRDEVDDFVLTGAGEPPEYTVELHNDMAYSPEYPSKFVITCLKKSQFGGETAICNGRELTANLEREGIIDQYKNKGGVRYTRYCLDQSEGVFNSWQRSLMTEDRTEAEHFLNNNGYSFEWDGSNLIYWNDAPATIAHPDSGEEIWFNQAHNSHCSCFEAMPLYEGVELPDDKYPANTKYADGDIIDRRDMSRLRRVIWETAVGVSLQEGDVLFLDNLAALHSRMSYEGDRVVRTSILK